MPRKRKEPAQQDLSCNFCDSTSQIGRVMFYREKSEYRICDHCIDMFGLKLTEYRVKDFLNSPTPISGTIH